MTGITQDIEDDYFAKKKIGAITVDLTADYDIVCHRGFAYKLLHLFSDKHMKQVTTELVRDRSFTYTTGSEKLDRFQRLKNGLLQ